MCDYAFFSKDPSWWDDSYQSLWGCHDICPILEQFHVTQVTQMELSSLTDLLAWVDPKRFYSDMAFLLILLKEGITGERVYGLAMVWVHLYQARVSTIEDMAKKLILLASAGPNWPYTFVQFNGNTHHMPLPKEGHLSAMMEGMPSNILCRRICQLEVCQLLHSEVQVVYPKGLNGCLLPVIVTLPESLSHGITMLDDKPTFLQVDISQFTIDEHESKTPFLGSGSISTSPTCPATEPPPRWRVKSAWPWRSVNSYCRWPWTPQVKHWGVPPQKTHVPSLSSTPSCWKVPSNQWTPPLRCPCRQAFQMMLNQMLLPLEVSVPVKTLELGASILPGMQSNSRKRWVRPWDAYWWLDPPWCPPQEACLRLWDGPLPEWVRNHQSH